MDYVLFPSDYFDKSVIDEALSQEEAAARRCGFEILIFSYQDWMMNGFLKLHKIPSAPVSAIYRGWMMKPHEYTRFYQALARNNVMLLTTPQAYEYMHVFPNVYTAVQADTVRSLFYPIGKKLDLDEIKRTFPRFMVKDYVKSVKGSFFPSYFDQTVSQEEFDARMQDFYRYRGDLFTGGICIKEYVDLKTYDTRKNEYRAFYLHGKLVSLSRNSSQATDTPVPPHEILVRYENLQSPFYTVDYAELENGSWIILEAGDGGVSGIPDGQDPLGLFSVLKRCEL